MTSLNINGMKRYYFTGYEMFKLFLQMHICQLDLLDICSVVGIHVALFICDSEWIYSRN